MTIEEYKEAQIKTVSEKIDQCDHKMSLRKVTRSSIVTKWYHYSCDCGYASREQLKFEGDYD